MADVQKENLSGQTTAAQRRVEAAEDILCGPQITNGADVQVNEAEGTIRIFGTLYTLDLFRALGAHGLAIGAHLKIVGRSDGAVHLQRIFEETDLHAEQLRLSQGLCAIAEAPEGAPAAVLRSVAYDIALNCIQPDTARFQIERRAQK